jgi:hypothetical protein
MRRHIVNEVKNIRESKRFRRIVIILRYIFLGLIGWSFFYSMFSITRKSTTGLIVGLTSTIIFVWMSSDIISPANLNNKEFGKYTKIIAFVIQLVTILWLSLLFGTGF